MSSALTKNYDYFFDHCRSNKKVVKMFLHATKLSFSSLCTPNSILCGDIGIAEGTVCYKHPRQSILYDVRRHVSCARANIFHSIVVV